MAQVSPIVILFWQLMILQAPDQAAQMQQAMAKAE